MRVVLLPLLLPTRPLPANIPPTFRYHTSLISPSDIPWLSLPCANSYSRKKKKKQTNKRTNVGSDLKESFDGSAEAWNLAEANSPCHELRQELNHLGLSNKAVHEREIRREETGKGVEDLLRRRVYGISHE